MTKRRTAYYIACGLILAAWILGFGAWMLLTPYPAVLYP